MIKKLFFMHFVILATYSNVMSQQILRSGYMITLENDTIYGEVENKAQIKSVEVFTFQRDGNKIDYSPNDISGYGVIDDFYYTSQVINSEFIEVLVVGDLSLYKSKNNFILIKDNNIYLLSTEFTEVEFEGGLRLKEDNTWRGIISYLLSDCLQLSPDKVKELDLSEESLTKTVIAYNKCNGNDYLEIKGKKPWIKMGYGIIPAIQFSTIKIDEALTYPGLDIVEYNSVDPSIGVLVNLSSPRISERISFSAEVNYYQSTYSSSLTASLTTSGSVKQHYESRIHLKTLFLPLTLNYSVPFNKLNFVVQAGANIDVHIDQESSLSREREIDDSIITYPDVTMFEVRKNQLSFIGGLGLTYKFNKFKTTCLIRYTNFRDFNEYNGIKSSANRFTFNLIFSR